LINQDVVITLLFSSQKCPPLTRESKRKSSDSSVLCRNKKNGRKENSSKRKVVRHKRHLSWSDH